MILALTDSSKQVLSDAVRERNCIMFTRAGRRRAVSNPTASDTFPGYCSDHAVEE